jgi:hypothetical protein
MSNTKQHKTCGHIVSLLVTVFCVATALLLVANRQFVADQLSVWQYRPNEEIATLADRSDMTDTGKFYFYSSQPKIESSQQFNNLCSRQENSTAILGCYNGRNIYIYNVTDQQLDGIREVTAAHEMLHAAYQRMSSSEKQTINQLLETEYAKLKDNKEFAERMAFYARTEPGERDNELHSVIGTEVSGISSELEAHYTRYFTDRSKVIALHAKYANVFAGLQARGDQLSEQLTQLGNTIEQESSAYNNGVSQLNKDIDSFNARAKSGEFATEEVFQSERNTLTSRADQLDTKRVAINSEVVQYNSLRQELEGVAGQSEALNRSIDSSLAPAPSL